MIERIKTSILLGLVITSLLLTSKLWEDIPTNRTTTGAEKTAPVFYDYDLTVEDIIKPPELWLTVDYNMHNRVAVNSENYNAVWDTIKGILREWTSNTSNMQIAKVPEEEWIRAITQMPGVRFRPPLKLYREPIKELLAISEIPKDILETEEIIVIPGNLMVIYFKTDNNYLRSSYLSAHNGKLREKIHQSFATGLNQYVQLPGYVAGIPVKKDIFVPVIPPALPEYRVNKLDKSSETIAQTFFADLSLVRKIYERNGAIVYIDGQRGLRIFPNGGVEYNKVILGSNGKGIIPTHLDVITSFVTGHGGWVKGLTIHRVERYTVSEQDTYVIEYGIDGFPIRGIQKLLEITIEDNQVRNFYRFYHGISQTKEKEQMISATEALDILVPILKDIPSGRGYQINSVEVCYIWSPTVEGTLLVPGWVVKYGELEFYVNGITGEYLQ